MICDKLSFRFAILLDKNSRRASFLMLIYFNKKKLPKTRLSATGKGKNDFVEHILCNDCDENENKTRKSKLISFPLVPVNEPLSTLKVKKNEKKEIAARHL